MGVKLPAEHHLKFLSLKGGCTGSSESTLVKMPHCWKSHIAAQIMMSPHKKGREHIVFGVDSISFSMMFSCVQDN